MPPREEHTSQPHEQRCRRNASVPQAEVPRAGPGALAFQILFDPHGRSLFRVDSAIIDSLAPLAHPLRASQASRSRAAFGARLSFTGKGIRKRWADARLPASCPIWQLTGKWPLRLRIRRSVPSFSYTNRSSSARWMIWDQSNAHNGRPRFLLARLPATAIPLRLLGGAHQTGSAPAAHLV
jgi:hypothetical protein